MEGDLIQRGIQKNTIFELGIKSNTHGYLKLSCFILETRKEPLLLVEEY